jgi:hypothetical protein
MYEVETRYKNIVPNTKRRKEKKELGKSIFENSSNMTWAKSRIFLMKMCSL